MIIGILYLFGLFPSCASPLFLSYHISMIVLGSKRMLASCQNMVHFLPWLCRSYLYVLYCLHLIMLSWFYMLSICCIFDTQDDFKCSFPICYGEFAFPLVYHIFVNFLLIYVILLQVLGKKVLYSILPNGIKFLPFCCLHCHFIHHAKPS